MLINVNLHTRFLSRIFRIAPGIYHDPFQMLDIATRQAGNVKLIDYPFNDRVGRMPDTSGMSDDEAFEVSQEFFDRLRETPSDYGVCDNYEQILKLVPELESDPDSNYIITITEVTKGNNGGWRWHKWGPYIGDHEPQAEYLDDEPNIDKVFCYHIYGVKSL